MYFLKVKPGLLDRAQRLKFLIKVLPLELPFPDLFDTLFVSILH